MNPIIIIISFISLLIPAYARASTESGSQGRHLSITQIQVRNTGDSIELSFSCASAWFNTRKPERITVTPVISDGVHQARFPSFAIIGKRKRMSPALQYNATMKYEDWMRGSILAFESNIKLCAKQAILTTAVVNNRILQDPDVEIVQFTDTAETVIPVLTTAEKLAQDYDFLADEPTRSEFDEENRSNAVSILFKTGSATLLPEYRNNSRNLDLLVDIILKINQSPDSRISHILIAGYASPDGDIRINSDFATLRAAALKKYLMRHTRLDSGTFEVINGKIDWYGLSQMVGKSDMLDKETVLNILSVTPVEGSSGKRGRKNELMYLKAGVPYRYMLKNFFPALRSSTCIKVFYEKNKNIK